MEEKILELLKEINEEILEYKGDNLYRDGLLDSIQVIDLVAELEAVFDIDIEPEFVILENFANKDSIIHFVNEQMEGKNGG